ncbi:MAG: hypothetical protein JST39_01395 [Bacteroidetes bacterium]|nr:hypothetical protein [Bacteroidota bacterium]
MPYQIGPIFLQGNYDDLCFYHRDGQWLVREKSSLTRTRVKRSASFKNTRYHAGILARGSKIGSYIYRSLPSRFKEYWMCRSFTGEAMVLLRTGWTDAEVTDWLWLRYVAEFEEGYKEEAAFIHTAKPVRKRIAHLSDRKKSLNLQPCQPSFHTTARPLRSQLGPAGLSSSLPDYRSSHPPAVHVL